MNNALPGISGDICGRAGGGCLQWTSGKNNDELIDVSCNNNAWASSGVGGQELDRNGGQCILGDECAIVGSGGGGYRGGAAGGVASSWWESGGGGRSYYDTANVFLEDNACGDRSARPGGYNKAMYPGGTIGYGGARGKGSESVGFAMATDGKNGYVVLQSVLDCPDTSQTFNAATWKCECPTGSYVFGGSCVVCTVCEGLYFASFVCDGVHNTVCTACTQTCGAGQFEQTSCTAVADTTCSTCKPPCSAGEQETRACGFEGGDRVCECAPGYYRPASTCTLCTPGYYCEGDDEIQHICSRAGMTSDAGATTDNECYCAMGYTTNGDNCTTCTADQYCPGLKQ